MQIIQPLLNQKEIPMKINPFILPRPKLKQIDYSFTLPDNSVFSVTLKELDYAEFFLVMDLVEHYSERYLAIDSEPKEIFPAVGNELVPLSKSLIQGACQVFSSQVDKIYTVEELIAFAVTCPDLWMDLLKTIGTLANPESKKKAQTDDQPENSSSSAVSNK